MCCNLDLICVCGGAWSLCRVAPCYPQGVGCGVVDLGVFDLQLSVKPGTVASCKAPLMQYTFVPSLPRVSHYTALPVDCREPGLQPSCQCRV